MKLGIVGGVSPYASSSFYNSICECFRDKYLYYPSILIYSIQVSIDQEEHFLNNNVDHETMLRIREELHRACEIFMKNEVKNVVICCNTLSLIFTEIAEKYNFDNILTPVSSLNKYSLDNSNCLLLATGYTLGKNLYRGFLNLSAKDQLLLERFIHDKINKNYSNINLDDILSNYSFDSLALGCTDIRKDDISKDVKVVDAMQCLIHDALDVIGDN